MHSVNIKISSHLPMLQVTFLSEQFKQHLAFSSVKFKKGNWREGVGNQNPSFSIMTVAYQVLCVCVCGGGGGVFCLFGFIFLKEQLNEVVFFS